MDTLTKNASLILKLLIEGKKEILTNKEILKHTKLSPKHFNSAVNYLSGCGAIETIYSNNDGEYKFSSLKEGNYGEAYYEHFNKKNESNSIVINISEVIKDVESKNNDTNKSKKRDLSEERVILEKLEVLLEDPITKSGYDTKDDLLNWSNKVAPLLQFNPQLQSKFLSYQDLAVLYSLKTQTRQAFQMMKSQVGMAIEELKLLIDFANSGEPIKEKIFLKGFYYDASKELRNIVKSAKDKIYVIDNYIDENILDFFTMKESKVDLKFITKNISKAARQMIKSYTQQYHKLEIRTSDNYHDRFIIIDEKTFYHFGASLKDLGKKVFMYSKIEENENKKMLLEKWQNDWIVSNKIK